MSLILTLPFEVLDALIDVVVGTADQRLGFAEAFVNPSLVLGISPFHESCEPFGHKPDLVAKV